MWNKPVLWGLSAKQITVALVAGGGIAFAGLKTYDEIAYYLISDACDAISTTVKIEREYRAERDRLSPAQKSQREVLDEIIADREKRADDICDQTEMPYRINCRIQKTWLRYRREAQPKINP